VARRDLTGAVDFGYLETFAQGDMTVVEEVLNLFREQAALWSALLRPGSEGLHDALHTIKGASRGVGAFALGEACAVAEVNQAPNLDPVHGALDAALADIAAYLHEAALQSLRTPGGYVRGAESTPDAL
jgi:hypothetical protein